MVRLLTIAFLREALRELDLTPTERKKVIEATRIVKKSIKKKVSRRKR